MADAILTGSGIYAIRNIINGKVYVGSTVHMGRRWYSHKRELLQGVHHSGKLQRAWNKYGSDAFIFEMLEPVSNHKRLIQREQFWIDQFDSCRGGYNVSPTAGNCLGTKHTEVSRANMSAAHIGKTASLEVRARMSAAQKGRVHTPEALAKQTASRAITDQSPETKAKRSAAATGRKMSPESVAKTAAALLGRKRGPFTEEHRARMSATRKLQGNFRLGTKHSEETKAKMRMNMKGAKARARAAREAAAAAI